ncbi:YLP motif-containing protein 1 [Exaiptasia diaphana]|nr:YLP motif-containing protein 1 [Exaiptasia diaphana]
MNKLDGIRPMKRRRQSSPVPSLSDDDDDDPYDEKEEDMRIGKKRVRWADLEEKKHMEHRRRIGFCPKESNPSSHSVPSQITTLMLIYEFG